MRWLIWQVEMVGRWCKEQWYWNAPLYVFGGLLVLGLYGCVLLVRAEAEWRAWADEHCKVIGKIESSVGSGLDYSGKPSTVFIPGKTGYRCDDGMEYWR